MANTYLPNRKMTESQLSEFKPGKRVYFRNKDTSLFNAFEFVGIENSGTMFEEFEFKIFKDSLFESETMMTKHFGKEEMLNLLKRDDESGFFEILGDEDPVSMVPLVDEDPSPADEDPTGRKSLRRKTKRRNRKTSQKKKTQKKRKHFKKKSH